MILDSLSEQAAAIEASSTWDAKTEYRFLESLNKASAENEKAGRLAAQAQADQRFADKARKIIDRAERARASQKRCIWLLAAVAIIVAIFPASSLSIMFGMISPRTGAAAMCLGLLLMGAMSCVTVQEFWHRHKSLR